MKDVSSYVSLIIFLGNYIKSKNSWDERRILSGAAKPPRVTEVGAAMDCGPVLKIRLKWRYYAILRKDTLNTELHVHDYMCFMCYSVKGALYWPYFMYVNVVNFKFNRNKSLKWNFQGIQLSRLQIFKT